MGTVMYVVAASTKIKAATTVSTWQPWRQDQIQEGRLKSSKSFGLRNLSKDRIVVNEIQ